MWEWRAFDEPGRLHLPPPLASPSGPRDQDHRTDLYLSIDGRPELGLKIRNVISPKVELKLRYEREPDGAELWAKVFERRFPLAPEWSRVLLELLGLDPAAARAVPDSGELMSLVVALDPRPIPVEKTITKVPAPPALELELAKIAVGKREVESVALEAPTLALLRSELRRHGLAGPSARAWGYPQALSEWLWPSTNP